jgi:hypothetical protein
MFSAVQYLHVCEVILALAEKCATPVSSKQHRSWQHHSSAHKPISDMRRGILATPAEAPLNHSASPRPGYQMSHHRPRMFAPCSNEWNFPCLDGSLHNA